MSAERPLERPEVGEASERLPWAAAAVAVALCVGLAVERLGRALGAPGRVLVGDWHHPDCLGNHWLLVWVAERLAAGQSLVHNDAYYWPYGDAPWLAGNGSEGLLYLPFHLLWGWPVGVAAYAGAVWVGNGLAGWALGRAAGAGPWAALACAAGVGTSAYAIQELGSGRFSQANLIFLVGGLAAWLTLLHRPSRGRALAAGALTAAAAGLYWYHGLFLALALGALTLGRALRREATPWRHVLGAGALSLGLVSPLLWVYLSNWGLVPGSAEAFPHPEAVLDSMSPLIPVAVPSGRAEYQALPLPALLLGGLGLVQLFRGKDERAGQSLGLWLVGALFFALALGTNGPLYEAIYGLAAPLRRMWWPHRHLVMSHLALFAFGAAALGRVKAPAWLAAAIAASFTLSMRLQSEPVQVSQSVVALPPQTYAPLAALPGEVLLQLPFSPKVASTQTPLIYQLFHRKKLLSGHAPWVDRVRPPEWDRLVAENSFLAGLMAYEEARLSGTWRFEAEDLQALIDRGFSHVVVDQEHYPLPLRALFSGTQRLMEQLFGKPVHRGPRAMVYATSGWSGRTEVQLPPWTWPREVQPGDGSQALRAKRSASPTFDPGVHERGGRR
ncbi:hypothetical protein L6R49_08925 [Myxococcota bacterium]|nr:hypothetical protein [Myxococcota bacterium]